MEENELRQPQEEAWLVYTDSTVYEIDLTCYECKNKNGDPEVPDAECE